MRTFLNPNKVLKQLKLKPNITAVDFGSGSGKIDFMLAVNGASVDGWEENMNVFLRSIAMQMKILRRVASRFNNSLSDEESRLLIQAVTRVNFTQGDVFTAQPAINFRDYDVVYLYYPEPKDAITVHFLSELGRVLSDPQTGMRPDATLVILRQRKGEDLVIEGFDLADSREVTLTECENVTTSVLYKYRLAKGISLDNGGKEKSSEGSREISPQLLDKITKIQSCMREIGFTRPLFLAGSTLIDRPGADLDLFVSERFRSISMRIPGGPLSKLEDLVKQRLKLDRSIIIHYLQREMLLEDEFDITFRYGFLIIIYPDSYAVVNKPIAREIFMHNFINPEGGDSSSWQALSPNFGSDSTNNDQDGSANLDNGGSSKKKVKRLTALERFKADIDQLLADPQTPQVSITAIMDFYGEGLERNQVLAVLSEKGFQRQSDEIYLLPKSRESLDNGGQRRLTDQDQRDELVRDDGVGGRVVRSKTPSGAYIYRTESSPGDYRNYTVNPSAEEVVSAYQAYNYEPTAMNVDPRVLRSIREWIEGRYKSLKQDRYLKLGGLRQRGGEVSPSQLYPKPEFLVFEYRMVLGGKLPNSGNALSADLVFLAEAGRIKAKILSPKTGAEYFNPQWFSDKEDFPQVRAELERGRPIKDFIDSRESLDNGGRREVSNEFSGGGRRTNEDRVDFVYFLAESYLNSLFSFRKLRANNIDVAGMYIPAISETAVRKKRKKWHVSDSEIAERAFQIMSGPGFRHQTGYALEGLLDSILASGGRNQAADQLGVDRTSLTRWVNSLPNDLLASLDQRLVDKKRQVLDLFDENNTKDSASSLDNGGQRSLIVSEGDIVFARLKDNQTLSIPYLYSDSAFIARAHTKQGELLHILAHIGHRPELQDGSYTVASSIDHQMGFLIRNLEHLGMSWIEFYLNLFTGGGALIYQRAEELKRTLGPKVKVVVNESKNRYRTARDDPEALEVNNQGFRVLHNITHRGVAPTVYSWIAFSDRKDAVSRSEQRRRAFARRHLRALGHKPDSQSKSASLDNGGSESVLVTRNFATIQGDQFILQQPMVRKDVGKARLIYQGKRNYLREVFDRARDTIKADAVLLLELDRLREVEIREGNFTQILALYIDNALYLHGELLYLAERYDRLLAILFFIARTQSYPQASIFGSKIFALGHSREVVARQLESGVQQQDTTLTHFPFYTEFSAVSGSKFKALYRKLYGQEANPEVARFAQTLDSLSPVVIPLYHAITDDRGKPFYPEGCGMFSEAVGKYLRERGFKAYLTSSYDSEHESIMIEVGKGWFLLDYTPDQYLQKSKNFKINPVIIPLDTVAQCLNLFLPYYPASHMHDRIPDVDEPMMAKSHQLYETIVTRLKSSSLDNGGRKVSESVSDYKIMTNQGERRLLVEAATALVHKLRGQSSQRTIVAIPGSGYWAAKLLEIVWTRLYPDDRIKLITMDEIAAGGGEMARTEALRIQARGEDLIILDDVLSTGHEKTMRITQLGINPQDLNAILAVLLVAPDLARGSFEYRDSFVCCEIPLVYGEAANLAIHEEGIWRKLPKWHFLRKYWDSIINSPQPTAEEYFRHNNQLLSEFQRMVKADSLDNGGRFLSRKINNDHLRSGTRVRQYDSKKGSSRISIGESADIIPEQYLMHCNGVVIYDTKVKKAALIHAGMETSFEDAEDILRQAFDLLEIDISDVNYISENILTVIVRAKLENAEKIETLFAKASDNLKLPRLESDLNDHWRNSMLRFVVSEGLFLALLIGAENERIVHSINLDELAHRGNFVANRRSLNNGGQVKSAQGDSSRDAIEYGFGVDVSRSGRELKVYLGDQALHIVFGDDVLRNRIIGSLPFGVKVAAFRPTSYQLGYRICKALLELFPEDMRQVMRLSSSGVGMALAFPEQFFVSCRVKFYPNRIEISIAEKSLLVFSYDYGSEDPFGGLIMAPFLFADDAEDILGKQWSEFWRIKHAKVVTPAPLSDGPNHLPMAIFQNSLVRELNRRGEADVLRFLLERAISEPGSIRTFKGFNAPAFNAGLVQEVLGELTHDIYLESPQEVEEDLVFPVSAEQTGFMLSAFASPNVWVGAEPLAALPSQSNLDNGGRRRTSAEGLALRDKSKFVAGGLINLTIATIILGGFYLLSHGYLPASKIWALHSINISFYLSAILALALPLLWWFMLRDEVPALESRDSLLKGEGTGKLVVLSTVVTSLVIAIFCALAHPHHIPMFILTFIMLLFPLNVFFNGFFAIAFDVPGIVQGRPFRNRGYTNIPVEVIEDTRGLTATLLVPIYDEDFTKVEPTLEAALREVADFNTHNGEARVWVCDDGLQKFSDNDVEGFYQAIQDKLAGGVVLSKDEENFLRRMQFYQNHPEIVVVARPYPVQGDADTQRAGSFKKASNLNYSIRLSEMIDTRIKQGDSFADSLAAVRLEQPKYALGYMRGEGVVGDYLLCLDKDSYLIPQGVLRHTLGEFLNDQRLAFTQHRIIPLNETDSFYSRISGYFLRMLYGYALPVKSILGGMVPLMGHNFILRKSALVESDLWREDRATEDINLNLTLQTLGYHSRFVAYPNMDFGEEVTTSFSDDAGKFSRYAYGMIEIVFNPLLSWLRRGPLTQGMIKFIFSTSARIEHKLDFLFYALSYLNLAMIIPFNLFGISYPLLWGVILGNFVFLIILFTIAIPTMMTFMTHKGTNAIHHQHRNLLSAIAYNVSLGYLMGLSFIAYSLGIAKSIVLALFTRQADFKATRVDERSEMSTKEAWQELAVTSSATIIVGLLAALSFCTYIIRGEPSFVIYFALYPIAVQLLIPYLFNPYLSRLVGLGKKESASFAERLEQRMELISQREQTTNQFQPQTQPGLRRLLARGVLFIEVLGLGVIFRLYTDRLSALEYALATIVLPVILFLFYRAWLARTDKRAGFRAYQLSALSLLGTMFGVALVCAMFRGHVLTSVDNISYFFEYDQYWGLIENVSGIYMFFLATILIAAIGFSLTVKYFIGEFKRASLGKIVKVFIAAVILPLAFIMLMLDSGYAYGGWGIVFLGITFNLAIIIAGIKLRDRIHPSSRLSPAKDKSEEKSPGRAGGREIQNLGLPIPDEAWRGFNEVAWAESWLEWSQRQVRSPPAKDQNQTPSDCPEKKSFDNGGRRRSRRKKPTRRSNQSSGLSPVPTVARGSLVKGLVTYINIAHDSEEDFLRFKEYLDQAKQSADSLGRELVVVLDWGGPTWPEVRGENKEDCIRMARKKNPKGKATWFIGKLRQYFKSEEERTNRMFLEAKRGRVAIEDPFLRPLLQWSADNRVLIIPEEVDLGEWLSVMMGDVYIDKANLIASTESLADSSSRRQYMNSMNVYVDNMAKNMRGRNRRVINLVKKQVVDEGKAVVLAYGTNHRGVYDVLSQLMRGKGFEVEEKGTPAPESIIYGPGDLPGLVAVGIEVPYQTRELVCLRDLIGSPLRACARTHGKHDFQLLLERSYEVVGQLSLEEIIPVIDQNQGSVVSFRSYLETWMRQRGLDEQADFFFKEATPSRAAEPILSREQIAEITAYELAGVSDREAALKTSQDLDSSSEQFTESQLIAFIGNRYDFHRQNNSGLPEATSLDNGGRAKLNPASSAKTVRLTKMTPQQVEYEFRKLIDQGLELKVTGEAKADPGVLLSWGYTPKYKIRLFDTRYYLTNVRADVDERFFVGYVLQRHPRTGKEIIYARYFYKDYSLIWRSASHYHGTELESTWLGKGDMKAVLEDGEEVFVSMEETTNLPLEIQSTLDTTSRKVPFLRQDSEAIRLIIRRAPYSRSEPYRDFTAPRLEAAQRNGSINKGKRIAYFTRENDPRSLRFVKAFEPDYQNGIVEISIDRGVLSELYGGRVEKYRILSTNRELCYQFLAGTDIVWANPPQAMTRQLTSYGVRPIDVNFDGDAFLSGVDYYEEDETNGQPTVFTQIPQGYVGRINPVLENLAETSKWNNRLPHIEEFKKRVLGNGRTSRVYLPGISLDNGGRAKSSILGNIDRRDFLKSSAGAFASFYGVGGVVAGEAVTAGAVQAAIQVTNSQLMNEVTQWLAVEWVADQSPFITDDIEDNPYTFLVDRKKAGLISFILEMGVKPGSALCIWLEKQLRRRLNFSLDQRMQTILDRADRNIALGHHLRCGLTSQPKYAELVRHAEDCSESAQLAETVFRMHMLRTSLHDLASETLKGLEHQARSLYDLTKQVSTFSTNHRSSGTSSDHYPSYEDFLDQLRRDHQTIADFMQNSDEGGRLWASPEWRMNEGATLYERIHTLSEIINFMEETASGDELSTSSDAVKVRSSTSLDNGGKISSAIRQNSQGFPGDRQRYLEHANDGILPFDLAGLERSFEWPVDMSNQRFHIMTYYDEIERKEMSSQREIPYQLEENKEPYSDWEPIKDSEVDLKHEIDIMAPAGTPVNLVEGGKVVYLEYNEGVAEIWIYSEDTHLVYGYAHLDRGPTNEHIIREYERLRKKGGLLEVKPPLQLGTIKKFHEVWSNEEFSRDPVFRRYWMPDEVRSYYGDGIISHLHFEIRYHKPPESSEDWTQHLDDSPIGGYEGWRSSIKVAEQYPSCYLTIWDLYQLDSVARPSTRYPGQKTLHGLAVNPLLLLRPLYEISQTQPRSSTSLDNGGKKKSSPKAKKPVPAIHQRRTKVFKATQGLLKKITKGEKQVPLSEVVKEAEAGSRSTVKADLETLELYGLLSSEKLASGRTLFSLTEAAFTCTRQDREWVSRYLYRLAENTKSTTWLFSEITAPNSKDPNGLGLRCKFRDLLVVEEDAQAALDFALEVSKYLDYRGPDSEAIRQAGELFFKEPVPDEENVLFVKPKRQKRPKEDGLLNEIELYLRTIAQYPRLTRLGEVFLCIRARYENEEMAKIEDPELHKQFKRPNENRVVEGNLQLVVATAKKYHAPPGFSFMDLIGAGNLGLRQAVPNYEPQSGFKFSTYATWWIRQTISRWITDSRRAVRVTISQQDKDQKTKAKCLALGVDLLNPNTSFDQAQAVTGMSLEEFEAFRTRNLPILSIHQAPSGRDQDERDFSLESSLETSEEGVDVMTLRLLIQTIVERTEEILRNRWAGRENLERDLEIWRLRVANDMLSAVEPVEALTLQEIGDLMKVSRERVRQIEVRAREVLGPVAVNVLKDTALAAAIPRLGIFPKPSSGQRKAN